VVVARVSKEDQHLDAQTPALLAEAERRGYRLICPPIEDTMSGRRMTERDGYRRLLAMVENEEIDVVLIAELTRIGRCEEQLPAFLRACRLHDVTIVALRETIDLSTADGRFTAGLKALMAVYEVDRLHERTRSGLVAAAKRGRAIGTAPYGTRWVLGVEKDAPATLAPVEEELETLRRGLELRRSLGTWSGAAAALNAERRLTRRGRLWTGWKLGRSCRNERAREHLGVSA
jgi:DNA invertase Pin-like site-specific DNA recombinase